MKTQIVMSMEEYKELPIKIADLIIAESKKGWGVKFISRETGKVCPDDAMRGFLWLIINKILPIGP